MPVIEVKAIAGRYCLTMTEGEALYRVLLPLLRQGQSVELDFEGVSMYASPFFNAAVGQLARDFSREQLAALLSIRNLSSDGLLVLKRSIENSALYYGEARLRDAWDESTVNV